MIDIQLLRKDLNFCSSKLADRGFQLDVDRFEALEQQRKLLQTATEDIQNQRTQLSKIIGQEKSKGNDCTELMSKASELHQSLKENEAQLQLVQEQMSCFLMQIPNLPDASVPVGSDETHNFEVSRWGTPKAFSFPVQDHVDLGKALGLELDLGTKLSGSRFCVLQGQMAKLHRALTQFMLDIHTQEHGYTEAYVPYLVNHENLLGTGQLPKFADDLFAVPHTKESQTGSLEAESMYLIPTAEVPLTNFLRNEIVPDTLLPLKWVAHTPCFRSEAGSYGRDTRGMIRQHQFDKVELVQAVKPDDSAQALELLTQHAETILQRLQLPYRKMLLCTGDLGFGAAKTYDLEVWLPAQQQYREISSCSNMTDFQSRRMQARLKTGQQKPQLLHTLNGSGLAVGRTLVAILENYQEADGSVTIPEALVPYCGFHQLSKTSVG